MIKQLLTTLLLLTTYRVNYLSSSGQLGESMMNLREVFPFPYMPAGWTFAIAWSAIYLMLAVRCIWTRTKAGRDNEINQKILPWFRISSVLNIIWIFFTARTRYALSVIVIASLMVVLRKILAITREFRERREFHRGALVTRNVFGLYAGWITMATMIVGSSQFFFLVINQQRPLTMRWTVSIIAFGTAVAGRLYRTYRNPSQLLITFVALAGVISSIRG